MTTLIVILPLESPAASSEYEYLLTPDGGTLAEHGRAPANLLPATVKPGSELVLIVPARAMSWHRLVLPKGTLVKSLHNKQRLRAVLSGLLEEALLDEPEQLHFALAPDALAPRADAAIWVGVCDRTWLRASLQVFEAAQRPVSRIVPEFPPGPVAHPGPTLYVAEGLAAAELIMPSVSGVTVLPLSVSSLSLLAWPAENEVVAEPGLVALAEQMFKRRVRLQQSSQRWLQAAQSSWNLAQFELSSSGHAFSLKRLAASWHSLLGAPRWRAVRWGAVLLVAINLVGLNAWAWRENSIQADKRAAINSILIQTFPAITVVVDAPVQMARSVAALRQDRGESSDHDLESLLSNLYMVLPAGQAPTAIDFAAGEARLKGLTFSATEATDLASQLNARGYVSRQETDSLVIRKRVQP